MIINKLNKKAFILVSLIIIYIAISVVYSKLSFFQNEIVSSEKVAGNFEITNINNIVFNKAQEIIDKVIYDNTVGKIVWDGLTMSQLTDKLNRVLNSTLAGTGSIFAEHSLKLGMDPYLAVAIVLQETCNNVGGQKGSPSCNGGSYKAYNTLEEGIIGFLDNLYYNYYAYGLTTAVAMNPKYAESTAWSYNVNAYIEKIKAA